MCDPTTLKFLSDIVSICQKDPSLFKYAEDGIQKIITTIQSDQFNDDNESYKNLKIYDKIQRYINENKKTFPKIKEFKLFIELIRKNHKTQSDSINKPSTSFRKPEMYAYLERIYESDKTIFDQIKQFIDDQDKNKA